MIRAILAHDSSWGIGKNNNIPWPRNSGDLRWFKEKTVGHTVVMGRKTWESLPLKPLAKRRNIVISSSEVVGVESCSLQWFKAYYKHIVPYNNSKDFWIIGGAQLLEACLDVTQEIWLNNVGGNYFCDTFLPVESIQSKFHVAHKQPEDYGTITVWRNNAAVS